MKKHTLLSTLLIINSLFFFTDSFAQFVSVERAQKVVVSLFNERKPSATKTITVTEIENNALIYYKGVAAYYIFNITGDAFVIVSADERIYPVLGYSFQSDFDLENVPDCLDWLLAEYKEQIFQVVSDNVNNKNLEINKDWEKYETENQQKSNSNLSAFPNLLSVAPLTTTTWSQGCFYNDLCPADNSLGATRCGRVPVGCVATAFGQVMKYHNHPSQGTGSNSYSNSNYGNISANFGTATYNWAAMPNKPLSASPEVAKVLYHAGVSVDMTYTANSSSAFTTAVRTALVNNFKYASTAQNVNKSSYSNIQWETLIRTELDANRIVIISGSDPVANAGHAFIADGYQGTNSFHINWGWNGSSDGYFLLTALSPSTYSFNTSVGAIIGIKPLVVAATCPVVTGLVANNLTPSSATLAWAAVTGSANSYNVKYKLATSSTWTTLTTSGTSIAVSGLIASSSYHFQVQRVCSGVSSSNYSASTTFTTTGVVSNNTTVTIGTGTGTTGAAPYGTSNMDERTQFIITKSQLLAAGYTSSTNFIKSIAFNVSSASSQTMNGFTIKIGHTTLSSFPSASFLTGTTTTVYSGSKVVTSGWNTHTFTNSFSYNGTGNLLIDICWNNASTSSNSNVKYTGTAVYQTIYNKTNVSNGGVCNTTPGTLSYNRPNIKLVFSSSAQLAVINIKALDETPDEKQGLSQAPLGIILYPNPAENITTIYFEGHLEKAQIKVFDIMGKQVFIDYIYNNNYELQLENYAPGIYQLILETENQQFSKKLIVQKNL